MIDATTVGIVDEAFMRARQPCRAFLESHRGITPHQVPPETLMHPPGKERPAPD